MNRAVETTSATPPSEALRFEILGPMRVWRGHVELDTGPRQQRRLLALLLARAGRPVSRSELIDLMWESDPPRSAMNVIHKYVGALRHLFEPTLPPRGSGSYILGRGSGYLFASASGQLDLAMFRERVRAAARDVAEQRHDTAMDHYLDGLSLWRAPAGDGVDLDAMATPIFVGLNNEFFEGCLSAAELALSLRRPAPVLPALELAASMAPLHEPLHAALMAVLSAVGRQADALSVYSTVRTRLAEELGIDSGDALELAYQRVLSGRPTTAQRSAVVEFAAGPTAHVAPHPRSTGEGFVGRDQELAQLRRAVEPIFTGGTGLALVEGEPGIGKTCLLEELAGEAERRGAVVVWGRCRGGDGTPSLWPWAQVVDRLLDDRLRSVGDNWLSGELGQLLEPSTDVPTVTVIPGSNAQFRLFERLIALLAQVAARGPLLVVVDDLQSADVASLELFSHVLARLPAGVAMIGALRDRAPIPGTDLARALAAASREHGHHRIRLGPLSRPHVAELVRRQTGHEPDPEVVLVVHARTDGNPFFVRELARLVADGRMIADEAMTRSVVPPTVRDVLRDRLAGLDDGSTELLQIAALVGRITDIALLARAGGLDIETCLDHLEPLAALGVLEPRPGDPFSFRFAHDIVRESVSEMTPPRRASQLHLRIADALEHTDGAAAPERLAHHLWAAGPLADPARTAEALVRAGRCAAGKTALEAATQHLQAAAGLAQRAGLADLELAALSELAAVAGMQSMYGASALDLLERAEYLARELGRPVEATGFLFTRWAVHAQATQLDRSGPLARRLLDEGHASGDPILRAYGLNAWGIHQWAIGNVHAAMGHLTEAHAIVVGTTADRERDPVGHDLRLLVIGMRAETTALHGDVSAAWALLDAMDAGTDDAYTITVAAAIKARIAAIAGDTARAFEAADRGLAVDPQFSFVFLGTYQRLARCWARALTGDDPAGAATEAESIIAVNLLDPPRSCVATWYGLLGEMRLAAGMPDEAGAALDVAEACLDTYGQRYPEALLMLLRARVLHAQGEPLDAVLAVADRARVLAIERGAGLFARRAGDFLAGLAAPTVGP